MAIRNVFICFLFALLTACGFHLRGHYNFPPSLQQVYVSYAKINDMFVVKLKQDLTNAGITLVDRADKANYILQINSINEAPVLQSTSTTGQVSTYLMQYRVVFTLTDAKGFTILPAQQVGSNASYTISSGQLLTSFSQQPNLNAELQEETINQIMYRLSSNHARQLVG